MMRKRKGAEVLREKEKREEEKGGIMGVFGVEMNKSKSLMNGLVCYQGMHI